MTLSHTWEYKDSSVEINISFFSLHSSVANVHDSTGAIKYIEYNKTNDILRSPYHNSLDK